MGYSTGIFSEIGPIFKMAITRKILVCLPGYHQHSNLTVFSFYYCAVKFINNNNNNNNNN